jgi:DNA circularisation protein N-terminus
MPLPVDNTSSPGLPSNQSAPATNVNNASPNSGDFNVNADLPDPFIGNPTAIQLDPISNLLEMQLNGTPFPVIHIQETGSQSLVQHLYPNVDSARVEPTGRNPSTFTVIAVLTNNIYPTSNETWVHGQLFPNTYNILLNYCYSNNKPCVLQHPYYGNRNVYVQSWDNDINGVHPRDGVFLRMTFLETIANQNIQTTISVPNTLGTMNTTASNLDADLNNLTPQLQLPGISFGQFMSAIAGTITSIINTPNLAVEALNMQVLNLNGLATQFGKILPNATSLLAGNLASLNNSFSTLVQTSNALAVQNQNLLLHGPVVNAYTFNKTQSVGPTYNIPQPIPQMNALYNALWNMNNSTSNNAQQFVSNAIGFHSAMLNYYQAFNRIETAQLVEDLYQMLNQLINVQNTLPNSNPNGWTVQSYIVPRTTTLINLCSTLNQTIDNMIALNPNMNGQYSIPEATVVQYFQA